jgi:hypothetical protein
MDMLAIRFANMVANTLADVLEVERGSLMVKFVLKEAIQNEESKPEPTLQEQDVLNEPYTMVENNPTDARRRIQARLSQTASLFNGRLCDSHIDRALDQYEMSQLPLFRFLTILDKAENITRTMSKKKTIHNQMGYFVACVQKEVFRGRYLPISQVDTGQAEAKHYRYAKAMERYSA